MPRFKEHTSSFLEWGKRAPGTIFFHDTAPMFFLDMFPTLAEVKNVPVILRTITSECLVDFFLQRPAYRTGVCL